MIGFCALKRQMIIKGHKRSRKICTRKLMRKLKRNNKSFFFFYIQSHNHRAIDRYISILNRPYFKFDYIDTCFRYMFFCLLQSFSTHFFFLLGIFSLFFVCFVLFLFVLFFCLFLQWFKTCLWIRFVSGSINFFPSRGSKGVKAPNCKCKEKKKQATNYNWHTIEIFYPQLKLKLKLKTK